MSTTSETTDSAQVDPWDAAAPEETSSDAAVEGPSEPYPETVAEPAVEPEPYPETVAEPAAEADPTPTPSPAPIPTPAPTPAPDEPEAGMTEYVVQQSVVLKRGREDVDAWIDLDTMKVRSGDRKGAVTAAMEKHSLAEGTFRPIPKSSTGSLTPKQKTTIDWS
jgi:outer membrane biosynthesis protein TonB